MRWTVKPVGSDPRLQPIGTETLSSLAIEAPIVSSSFHWRPIHLFQRNRSRSVYLFCSLVLFCLAVAPFPTEADAQKKQPTQKKAPAKTKPAAPDEVTPDLPPFSVDARIYQAQGTRGQSTAPTGQLFSLTTANLVDEENFTRAFTKVNPGLEIELVNSATIRVLRSSRPSRIVVGKVASRNIELLFYGAHSVGKDNKPGTSLVIELDHDLGRAEAVALFIQTIEVEDGKTFFFTVPTPKLNPDEYVQLLRPSAPAAQFRGKDTFLLFSFSTWLKPVVSANRRVDEQRAIELQAAATRKVQPEVPQELKSAGLNGRVRVSVEIGADGRVAHAILLSSTYPEMNKLVLAAARQWEFPIAEFEKDKRPIVSVLVFDLGTPTSGGTGTK